ncbi:MAG: hydrogenase maturation nickel metallochaperone HypA [Desulfobacteraceae bacterium]|nr:MAG: hydrogenase maturation nickel metallochaperone HypA [Desulfobacteraceae bacterium]
MHELSIAQRIVDIVSEEMSRNGLTRVDAVTLKVGDMAQILPDSLLFGFECLTDRTPLAGAKLIIVKIPARGSCKACVHEFDIDGWLLNCPRCQGTAIDILSGKELEIVEIEGQ